MSANRLKENGGTDGASKCLIIILCHRTRVKDDEQIKVHMQLEIFRGGRNCFCWSVSTRWRREGERKRIEVDVPRVVQLVMMWT